MRRVAPEEPGRVHRSSPNGAVGGGELRSLGVWTRAYLGLVAFSLAGSLFSRLAHLDPGPIAPIAALLTLLTGAVAAFAPYVRVVGPRAWWALLATLVLGAVVEIAGVGTGIPFGRYAYTSVWWPVVQLPHVGWFPLQVPLAWFLMAGASALATGKVWAAGLLAAGLDLVMEPVMVRVLGYWRWLEPGPLPGGAPLLNFVGWLATAAVAAWLVLRGGIPRSRDAAVVLAGHSVLTLGIGAIGLWFGPGR